MARWRTRTTLVCLLLVLAGCATQPPAGVVFPTLSPRREALSYFPSGAPVVAVVKTDPQAAGVRRLAASGALEPLRRAAEAEGVYLTQLIGLLGNDAVIGQPHVDGPPLAVLMTEDDETLDALAKARVIARRATVAGSYRGADLYAERRLAFAVRGRVLLVARTTRQLFEALDTRASDDGFEAARLNAVLPATEPPAVFVRAFVDLRPLVDRAGAAGRSVPLLRALSSAGLTVGSTATELQATLGADTSAEGLTEGDLPALGRPQGRRPTLPDAFPAVAVSDLSALALAAERAARAALPVSVLRVDALRTRLAGAGVRLTPRLLEGPAAIVLDPGGPRLRLQPARPEEVRRTLERVARRLRSPGLRVTREGGLYTLRRRGRLVVRVGLLGGALVAGRAPAAALRAMAAAPLTRLRSPVLVRLPSLGRWYPRPVVLTLGGSPDQLRLDGFSGF